MMERQSKRMKKRRMAESAPEQNELYRPVSYAVGTNGKGQKVPCIVKENWENPNDGKFYEIAHVPIKPNDFEAMQGFEAWQRAQIHAQEVAEQSEATESFESTQELTAEEELAIIAKARAAQARRDQWLERKEQDLRNQIAEQERKEAADRKAQEEAEEDAALLRILQQGGSEYQWQPASQAHVYGSQSTRPDYQPARLDDALSDTMSDDEQQVEKVQRFKRPSRKSLMALGGVGAVAALSMVVGPKVLGGGENAPVPIAAEAAPGVELTADDIDILSCLEKDGKGDTLVQGEINLAYGVQWPYKVDTGVEGAPLETLYVKVKEKPTDKESRFPRVTLAEAAVDFAACADEADRSSVVEVVPGGEKVVVNLAKVDPEWQIGGLGRANADVESYGDLAEKKEGQIVLSKEEAEATNALDDPKGPNIEWVINNAAAEAGLAISDPKGKYAPAMKKVLGQYKSLLEEEVREDIAAFYEKNSLDTPEEPVAITFVNELPNQITYKGDKPTPNKAGINLAKESLKIFQDSNTMKEVEFNPLKK